MIYGVGTDLVEVRRIAEVYQRFGQRFVQKILSPKERLLFPKQPQKQVPYLAKRFAAKEAIAKALGTGIGKLCRFHDCQVLRSPSGQPIVEFSARMKEFHPQVGRAHLSLSDQHCYAQAFCVIEQA